MSYKKYGIAFVFAFNLFSLNVWADVTVNIFSTQTNQKIGTITFQDTLSGLLITPNLHGLSPGQHGFHVHVNPSCEKSGQSAGNHLDPTNTQQHRGPYQTDGHLGDMPSLYVDQQGVANKPILAPRLHESDMYGHALVIHAGSDNFLDVPKPLGGGGDRIACGVIPASQHFSTP